MPQPKKTGRAEGGGFNAEALNNVVQTIALLAAGIWGVYTFVYQAKVVPSLAPPTLSVTCTVEKAGQRGNLMAIRSTVTRANVGQTRVRLLGIAYNVIGIKERFGKGIETNPGFNNDVSASGTIREARHYGKPEKREVILRVGSLFEGATTLPSTPSDLYPGESVSRDIIFYADQTLYDSVRIQVRLVYAKMSEPPIPLTFEVDGDGLIVANPDRSCAKEKCRGLNATDFTTELSLW